MSLDTEVHELYDDSDYGKSHYVYASRKLADADEVCERVYLPLIRQMRLKENVKLYGEDEISFDD